MDSAVWESNRAMKTLASVVLKPRSRQCGSELVVMACGANPLSWVLLISGPSDRKEMTR